MRRVNDLNALGVVSVGDVFETDTRGPQTQGIVERGSEKFANDCVINFGSGLQASSENCHGLTSGYLITTLNFVLS